MWEEKETKTAILKGLKDRPILDIAVDSENGPPVTVVAGFQTTAREWTRRYTTTTECAAVQDVETLFHCSNKYRYSDTARKAIKGSQLWEQF